MIKHFLNLFILFVFGSGTIQSQVLEATVLDAASKAPLSYANVYLEGTTIGTVAGEDGRFRIETKDRMLSALVVQFIGYKSLRISNPFISLPDTVYLQEDDHIIPEIVVTAKEKYSRTQKMRLFKRYFLGDTDAGRSCKIINEEDISLIFDSENRILRAFSTMPVIIENNYLLYRIRWEITDFHIRFDRGEMLERYMEEVSNIGISAFEDRSGGNNRIMKRRNELYGSSPACLFSHIANGSGERLEMTLLKGGFPFPAEQWFEITQDREEPSVKQLVMNPLEQNREGEAVMDVEQHFPANRLKPKLYSRIVFQADTFRIDTYGNIHPIDKLLFLGDWSSPGIGNLLPLDYRP